MSHAACGEWVGLNNNLRDMESERCCQSGNMNPLGRYWYMLVSIGQLGHHNNHSCRDDNRRMFGIGQWDNSYTCYNLMVYDNTLVLDMMFDSLVTIHLLTMSYLVVHHL